MAAEQWSREAVVSRHASPGVPMAPGYGFCSCTLHIWGLRSCPALALRGNVPVAFCGLPKDGCLSPYVALSQFPRRLTDVSSNILQNLCSWDGYTQVLRLSTVRSLWQPLTHIFPDLQSGTGLAQKPGSCTWFLHMLCG